MTSRRIGLLALGARAPGDGPDSRAGRGLEVRLDELVLFNGRDIDAINPVWDYVPRWTLITMPLVLLVGMAFSLVLVRIDTSAGQGHCAVGRRAVSCRLHHRRPRHDLRRPTAPPIRSAADGRARGRRMDGRASGPAPVARRCGGAAARRRCAAGLVRVPRASQPGCLFQTSSLQGRQAHMVVTRWITGATACFRRSNSHGACAAGRASFRVSGWPLHIIRVDASATHGSKLPTAPQGCISSRLCCRVVGGPT